MAEYKFTRVSSPYPKIAGRRIKLAREGRKLRQQDVAEALNVASTTIGNYEQGTREMTADTAARLGKLLHEHPAYLIGLIDEMDRDILRLPIETRMHIIAALQSAPKG